MFKIALAMAVALFRAAPSMAGDTPVLPTARASQASLRYASLDRIFAAVPEARSNSEAPPSALLSEAARQWSDRLTSSRQMDVALLVLLSYGLPDRPSSRRGADTALAAAFLAAQLAAGGVAGDSRQDHVLDTGASGSRRGTDGPDRQLRAQRALAWGERMGICDAAFISTLRELPGPAPRSDGRSEPDMRRAIRDLGLLAYDNRGGCTADAARD